MDRRSFLMTPGLFTAREAMSWQGANDRINLAVVGVRGRGRDQAALGTALVAIGRRGHGGELCQYR